jgi:hypothetical protein
MASNTGHQFQIATDHPTIKRSAEPRDKKAACVKDTPTAGGDRSTFNKLVNRQ